MVLIKTGAFSQRDVFLRGDGQTFVFRRLGQEDRHQPGHRICGNYTVGVFPEILFYDLSRDTHGKGGFSKKMYR
jgi:hypothetical protein